MLTKGLDVTMDELAECSGASRRTLFRHFTTRDKLLAAAFEAGIVDSASNYPLTTAIGIPGSVQRATPLIA